MRSNLELVIEQFLDHFKSKSYIITSPSELITDDKTLLFTNDTITAWKSFLIDRNIPYQGLCMNQPCLRLRGLKDTICKENQLEITPLRFLGYFNSLGILIKKSEDEIQTEILELFLQKYKIPNKEIIIYAQEDMKFLNLIKNHIKVDYNSNPKIYYEWRYGIKDLIGRGATFMLLQEGDNFQEIGQLIKIQDLSGEIIGYEFGVGAETFLSRKNKNKNYSAWSIYDVIQEKNLCFKTLLDNYSCLGAMLSIPNTLMTNRHFTEKRKVIRNIALLQDIFGISSQWSESVLKDFLQLEFGMELNQCIKEEIISQYYHLGEY